MKPIELLVDQQIKRWELERRRPQETETIPISPGPVITISRQRGSGGSLVAERLAELTGFSHFNREIIDQISREMGAQKRLVESLDEATRSGFQLWVDGIFRGRIVDSSDYMQSLVKIIGAIINHGKAIVVGRGANFLATTPNVFNIRIIADMTFRVDSIIKRRGLSRDEATEEIETNDNQRRKFIKNHFGRDIDDPAAYDLIVNSTDLDIDRISTLILGAYPLKVMKA
jgi:cytidylate kinase